MIETPIDKHDWKGTSVTMGASRSYASLSSWNVLSCWLTVPYLRSQCGSCGSDPRSRGNSEELEDAERHDDEVKKIHTVEDHHLPAFEPVVVGAKVYEQC